MRVAGRRCGLAKYQEYTCSPSGLRPSVEPDEGVRSSLRACRAPRRARASSFRSGPRLGRLAPPRAGSVRDSFTDSQRGDRVPRWAPHVTQNTQPITTGPNDFETVAPLTFHVTLRSSVPLQ